MPNVTETMFRSPTDTASVRPPLLGVTPRMRRVTRAGRERRRSVGAYPDGIVNSTPIWHHR